MAPSESRTYHWVASCHILRCPSCPTVVLSIPSGKCESVANNNLHQLLQRYRQSWYPCHLRVKIAMIINGAATAKIPTYHMPARTGSGLCRNDCENDISKIFKCARSGKTLYHSKMVVQRRAISNPHLCRNFLGVEVKSCHRSTVFGTSSYRNPHPRT